MISKKLSARKLFERLLQQECMRTVWAEGIITVALIFALPVSLALDMGQYASEISSMPDSTLLEFVSGNTTLFVIIFFLSIFISLLEFGYLFQRSKVDFYHSLPISRSMQFAYRYLTGFLLFALPFVIMYSIAILIGIAHGAMIVGYMKELAGLALIYMVFYWVLYSVSVIAVQLAGSYLSSILTLLSLHFGGVCFCQLIQECQKLFFRTYVDTGKPLLYGEASAITICSRVLEQFRETGYYDTFSLTVLSVLVVLLPAAGYLLFIKRKAEKTGCGLAYPLIGPFICFLAVTGVGIVTGMLLRTLSYSNKDFWLFFGIIIGCIVMHCVMQMVLLMNFRAFFQNRVFMLVCTVCAVAFMCVFRFDLTGYDTYLPSADQLESVGVSLGDLEYYRSYIKEYSEEEYRRIRNLVYSTTYNSQEECRLLAEMNLKNVQPVLKLVSASLEDTEWGYNNMKVCYQLKNGRCVYRAYMIDLQDHLAECSEIFSMDRYKEVLYPILTRGEENCNVWVYDSYSDNKKKLTLEDTQYITLLRTYKRELKNLSLETMEEEEPQALLEFMNNQNDFYNSYPVYPSFEHTLTLLKGYGYEHTLGSSSIYKVHVVYQETYDEAGDVDYAAGSEDGNFHDMDGVSEASDQYASLWTEDKEQLKELSPYLVSSYFSSINMTLQKVEPGFYVTAYMTDRKTGEEVMADFYIQKGKVPDFLKKLKNSAQENVG